MLAAARSGLSIFSTLMVSIFDWEAGYLDPLSGPAEFTDTALWKHLCQREPQQARPTEGEEEPGHQHHEIRISEQGAWVQI